MPPKPPSPLAVVIRDYLRAGSYFGRHARSIAFLVTLGLLASGLAVLQPWPLKLLIDTILGGDPDAWMRWAGIEPKQHAELLIIIASLAAFLAYASASLVEMVLSYGWMKAGQKMVYDVAADLYGKLQQRSLAHQQERALGDSLNRLFGDSWSLYTISYTLLTVPLQHVLTIVVVGVIAWQLDSSLALIALGAVPVATVVSYGLAQMLRRISWQETKLNSEIMTFVQQTLSVIPLVQTFGATARTQKIYRGFAERSVGIAGRAALVNQTILSLNTLTVALATSAVLLVGGMRVLSGDITLGVLVVFLAYLRTVNSSVDASLTAMVKIIAANAGLRRVCEILDEGPGVAEAHDAVPYRKPPARPGRIVFENVGFGYPGRPPVLQNVDLDIEPGETIALVGASGGGKSTLASLIPRFFDPAAGRVLLDGQDIRSLTLSSLRSQISVVLQEPFLMPMTVAENIAYDPKAYQRDEVIAAAIASGAHEFIRKLPQGYESIVGERGANLSGGQKQLIAISRALLKDAPILILDEPTSALDVETEAEVMRGLRTLMAHRTTLIVAHRLSTIRSADRVLLVHNGSIRQLGSLSELDTGLREGAAR